jgi:hypothetical protein
MRAESKRQSNLTDSVRACPRSFLRRIGLSRGRRTCELRFPTPFGILESLVGRHLADEKEEIGTGPALRYGLDLLRPRPIQTARTWPAVVLSLVTRTDDRPPKAAVG